MIKLSRIILYIIVIPISTLVFGQNTQKPYFSFDRISTENIKVEKGLSQNTVFTILQDSKGYMWFGTWDGLNKFDGYDFSVYRPNEPTRGNNLTDETIFALFEDEKSNLWIGTERGVSKFDNKNQQFADLLLSNKNLPTDRIFEIVSDSAGNIWLGTINGLFKFDEDKGKLVHYEYELDNANSLPNNHIIKLLAIDNRFLWIGTNGGFCKFDMEEEIFERYDKSNLIGLLSDTIQDLAFENDSVLWIATAKGLNRYNTIDGVIDSYTRKNDAINNNDVRALLFDKNKRLWIGTFGGGVSLYLPKEDKFNKYEFIATNKKTLGSNYVYSLYQDAGGIVWIGTRKGVSKVNLDSYEFSYFYHHSNTTRSLNSDIVWGFVEDEHNNLWIATDNGVNIYNRKLKRFNYLTHQEGNPNSLICNDVRCLMQDDSGYMWIGTNCGGLDKYDMKNKKIKHINTQNSNLSSDRIWDIKQDYKKNLWIATSDGLNFISAERDTIIVYKHGENRWQNTLVNNLVYALLPDSNLMWIATGGGMSVMNIETHRIRNFVASTGNSLSTNKLFSIFKDTDGIFWIGTINGGLNRYNPNTGEFKVYNTDDGLPNNLIYNVLEDDFDNLWISTNFGISKFNKKSEIFVNFDVRDGLQSNEFNLGAAFESRSGEMIFGGMNGFNMFYPEHLTKNDYAPKIIITSFEIQNKEVPREYEDGDSIFLDYYNNFFSFKFAGLDFSKPYKLRYAYKLENFNKDWIYTDASKRFADYTDVNPGNYVFRVKCTNSDGVMNKGIKVYIRIKPPWWRTYTFWIPFVLFMVFVGSNILYFRIRRLKQKNEMQAKMLSFEKQLFELEQKALRLQMNPHFIFNSLNSIQSFILENNRDKAVRYLSKFAKLMRLILYSTKESFINFSDEIKSLTYYLELEKLRFDSKFDFKIVIDKQIDTDFVSIPPMLIQPYVENAILHGVINKEEKGLIEVSFVQQQTSIQCIITDDGIGRKLAAELKEKSGLKHKSRSMTITRERLDIMSRQRKGKATVSIIDLYENGVPKGTKVMLDIPFKC